MERLERADRELDSCRDIRSQWKSLRSRLHDERVLPLRRHLQSLRNARPQPDFQELEQQRRSLSRLPVALRPRLWRLRTGNAFLKLTARLLGRGGQNSDE
ncbi:MAG TPA: hypothetical protein VLU25_03910 [Acidobacteriota bacterium]|nr:hypothetical protein [Acidobacteriota bacterium]